MVLVAPVDSPEASNAIFFVPSTLSFTLNTSSAISLDVIVIAESATLFVCLSVSTPVVELNVKSFNAVGI